MDDRLQKFVAVVEAGSFTAAAASLHISQPALSVAVAKLEARLKLKLIQQVGRQGIVLTVAGRAVYDAALEHRAIEHNLRQHLGDIAEQKLPLRVGMIDSVASLATADNTLLQSLEAQAELGLVVTNSSSLRAALRRDKLDLAIVVADDEQDVGVQVLARGADTMVLVCSAANLQDYEARLARDEPLPFVSYMQDSKTYQMVLGALESMKVRVAPLLYSTSPEVMVDMARRGRGAAVLPESMVRTALDSGELKLLHKGKKPVVITRKLTIIAQKGRSTTPAASEILKFVHATLQG